MTGLFQGKKREELAERIENLQNEIDLYKENRKYALQAQKEIDGLKATSETEIVRAVNCMIFPKQL